MADAGKGKLGVKFNDTFAYDLAIGQAEEVWLSEVLAGAKMEIKRDFLAHRTGNIYVEYHCWGKPSGIAITQADFWAFILNGQRVIIAPTDFLKQICRDAYADGRGGIRGGDSMASLGVLVKTEEFFK